MASHISTILTRALLAKAPLYGKLETAYQQLSTILPGEALRCAPDYLAAVANIVDIDLREICDASDNAETVARKKRSMLMGYLHEAKTRPQSIGPFLKHASRLLVTTQLVWVELAKERPADRLFTLGNSFPELILPKEFRMRHYFRAGEVDPQLVTLLSYAAKVPETARGMRKQRGKLGSPHSHAAHKTLQ
jgi:hypothetical protein